MNSLSYREQLGEMIDASISELINSEPLNNPAPAADWKSQESKPLRFKFALLDVQITVCHDPEPEFASDFRLECDLGPVADSRKDELFRRLLQENTFFDPSTCRGFGWDEQKKVVVFCSACQIVPQPDLLTDTLMNVANYLTPWQKFMSGSDAEELGNTAS